MVIRKLGRIDIHIIVAMDSLNHFPLDLVFRLLKERRGMDFGKGKLDTNILRYYNHKAKTRVLFFKSSKSLTEK